MHRARDRQHDRLGRVAQERRDEFARRGIVTAAGAARDAGNQPMDLADAGRGIGGQLPFAFIARRTDDRTRMRDCTVFLLDPRIDRRAWVGKSAALVHAERMRRVDERYAQGIFHSPRDIGSVSEMRMDEVGKPLALRKFGNQRFGKSVAVRAERFLGEVPAVTAVDSPDDELGTQPFFRLRMRCPQTRIVEPPRDDFGHLDIVAARQRFHLAEDVGDMSTSILCDPIADGFTLQAATKRDRYNMHNTFLNDPACLTVAVQSGSPNQPMFMLDTQRRPGVCRCRERRVAIGKARRVQQACRHRPACDHSQAPAWRFRPG